MQPNPLDLSTVTVYKGRSTDGSFTGFFAYLEWGGDRFEGWLVGGVAEGPGERLRPNGEFQRGDFRMGRLWSGEVRWTEAGALNEGIVREGAVWEGRGQRVGLHGVDEGQFRQGALQGPGLRRSPTGQMSEGVFEDGFLRSGTGWLDWDGWWYHGNIEDFLPDGSGKLISKNKRLSVDAFFAQGFLVSASSKLPPRDPDAPRPIPADPDDPSFRQLQKRGMTEIGQFIKGRLEGLGVRSDLRSTLQIGVFQNGRLSCGKQLTPTRLEVGRFKNGVLDGSGKIVYLGCVKDGCRLRDRPVEELPNWVAACSSREALLEVERVIQADDYASLEEGTFREGRLEGQGRSVMGGYICEGVFAGGKLNGPGKRRSPDGTIQTGTFVDGVLASSVIALPQGVTPSVSTGAGPKSSSSLAQGQSPQGSSEPSPTHSQTANQQAVSATVTTTLSGASLLPPNSSRAISLPQPTTDPASASKPSPQSSQSDPKHSYARFVQKYPSTAFVIKEGKVVFTSQENKKVTTKVLGKALSETGVFLDDRLFRGVRRVSFTETAEVRIFVDGFAETGDLVFANPHYTLHAKRAGNRLVTICSLSLEGQSVANAQLAEFCEKGVGVYVTAAGEVFEGAMGEGLVQQGVLYDRYGVTREGSFNKDRCLTNGTVTYDEYALVVKKSDIVRANGPNGKSFRKLRGSEDGPHEVFDEDYLYMGPFARGRLHGQGRRLGINGWDRGGYRHQELDGDCDVFGPTEFRSGVSPKGQTFGAMTLATDSLFVAVGVFRSLSDFEGFAFDNGTRIDGNFRDRSPIGPCTVTTPCFTLAAVYKHREVREVLPGCELFGAPFKPVLKAAAASQSRFVLGPELALTVRRDNGEKDVVLPGGGLVEGRFEGLDLKFARKLLHGRVFEEGEFGGSTFELTGQGRRVWSDGWEQKGVFRNGALAK